MMCAFQCGPLTQDLQHDEGSEINPHFHGGHFQGKVMKYLKKKKKKRIEHCNLLRSYEQFLLTKEKTIRE